eukprot:scaffold630279_cov37-Prasinocladus_malaysianus.AAC.1
MQQAVPESATGGQQVDSEWQYSNGLLHGLLGHGSEKRKSRYRLCSFANSLKTRMHKIFAFYADVGTS